MSTALRIVQIGFNRAGTSSLSDFLRRAGFTCVDHMFASGPYKGQSVAVLIKNNITAGRKPLAGLDAFQAFTDMEYVTAESAVYVQKRFREIAEAHPEVKFILNIRNKQDWLQSRAKFGGYLSTCAAAAKVSEAEMVQIWSAEWDTHCAAVKDYFTPERLLILDIDKPDEVALSNFVGSSKVLSLRQKNKAPRGPVSKYLQGLTSKSLASVFPQRFKNWIKNY
jgi:hypothetical protein